jgi:excisionase family DNA binding protein
MSQPNISSPMLTATDVARLLNLHVNTVRRWTDGGIINAYRIGSRGDRRYNQDDIHSFLARHSSKGRQTLPRIT